MITAWIPERGHLRPKKVSAAEQLSPNAVWLDLEKPDAEEFQWIERAYHQKLPDTDEITQIEASSRFFLDDTGLHVRAYFMHEIPERASNVTVAFILTENRLYTLRDEALMTFQRYGCGLEKVRETAVDAYQIMLGLFELKVDAMADLLEQLHIELEQLNARVFHADERDFEALITLLAGAQDRNDKARLSLVDKERALSFLLRSRHCPKEHLPLLREILRDIGSLNDHSDFVFQKVQFLMDATTGRIDIEQNKIIKIFSIAAVVFLPPTLIASIYGMNFRFMPELAWPFGYPLAIGLMLGAGLAPYWFFKRKGWL
jgi:magnesium transporter